LALNYAAFGTKPLNAVGNPDLAMQLTNELSHSELSAAFLQRTYCRFFELSQFQNEGTCGKSSHWGEGDIYTSINQSNF